MNALAITGMTLLASLYVLSRSSSSVVDNLVKLSRFLHISQISIGLILLSVATTLPELFISVISSVSGQGAIAAGNLFGSNIANILLVLGGGAFFFGLKVSSANLREIGLLLLLTTAISAYIEFRGSVEGEVLGMVEGIVLIGVFCLYVWNVLSKKREMERNNGMISKAEAQKAFLLFGVGIIIVIVSAGFVVDSAVKIAEISGVAESFIGATIIAVGTSLPEMSVGLQAIRKRHYGIVLGDAIGSNVIDITLILGISAAIDPIYVNLPIFSAALLFAIIANMLLLYVSAVDKRLGRLGGAAFIAVYLLYLAVIFMLQLRELAVS
ncbi:MAG: sodium:calcium antiporter [Candidatus Bilamarchaeaceae archaeon]